MNKGIGIFVLLAEIVYGLQYPKPQTISWDYLVKKATVSTLNVEKMWRDWLIRVFKLTPNDMSDKEKSENTVIVHGTSGGKLYIEEREFFKNRRVIAILKKLLNSSAVKEIKNRAQASG